jgi:hypothetical protein
MYQYRVRRLAPLTSKQRCTCSNRTSKRVHIELYVDAPAAADTAHCTPAAHTQPLVAPHHDPRGALFMPNVQWRSR